LGFCDKYFSSSFFIMPADRTQRTKQIELGNRIERLGQKMVACSRCERAGRSDNCIGMPSGLPNRRCAECSRQGKTCDFVSRNRMPELSDWDSIDRQREQLREEEEKAIAASQEAMAKILRLRKQQRFLDEREKKMIQSGLNSLDELDKLEERERLEKEQVEQADRAPQLSSSRVDPSIFELPPMSDSELAAWLEAEGSFGGISPSQIGSSSS
jgi:hypothetical protein